MGGRGAISGANRVARVVVTFNDGKQITYRLYKGAVINEKSGDRVPSYGDKPDKFIQMIKQNSTKQGFTYKTYNQKQVAEDERKHREERKNTPDYELGGGVPWGNVNNRRAARAGRSMTRAQRARRWK